MIAVRRSDLKIPPEEPALALGPDVVRASREARAAITRFNEAVDPDLVDAAILDLGAAEARFRAAVRDMKGELKP